MDHDRSVLLTVSSDVLEFETLRKLEVKLDRTALPCSADRIYQMEVDLRTVECAVAFVDHIVESEIIKSAL